LYDANDAPVGNDFVPEQLTDSRNPDVAMDAQGNFIVVWMQDKSTNSIMARLYTAAGTPKSAPFVVSSVGFSSQTQPAVAADYGGNFVVTWDGHSQAASMDDIYARWYNSDAVAIAEQFLVNTTLGLAQERPRVAMTTQGEFVIVWQSQTGADDYARDVFAQRYNAASMPVGDELRLNSYTLDDQKYPAVAISQTARFIAAWQSWGQDGSHYGIFATSAAANCPADFSGDAFVNFLDYRVLANQWRTTGTSLTADLIENDIIDPRDLAEFARHWLTSCR